MLRIQNTLPLILLILFSTTNAHAYIGPGTGVGAFAIFAAVVLGVVLLFIAVVWFPIKRRFFSSNSDKNKQTETNEL